MTSAHARTLSYPVRAGRPCGGTPARTASMGVRSSARSSCIATGSENRPAATLASAAARPWRISTAVRLGARSFSFTGPCSTRPAGSGYRHVFGGASHAVRPGEVHGEARALSGLMVRSIEVVLVVAHRRGIAARGLVNARAVSGHAVTGCWFAWPGQRARCLGVLCVSGRVFGGEGCRVLPCAWRVLCLSVFVLRAVGVGRSWWSWERLDAQVRSRRGLALYTFAVT